MNIRAFTDADTEAVVHVWHRAGRAEYTYLPTWQIFSEAEARSVFSSQIASKDELWVGVEGHGITCYLAMFGSYIDRLYVHPAHQRCGCGTALVDHAKSLCPSGLELHTHQQNLGARALYGKLGFTAIRFGTSPAPESAPDVEYHWRPD